REVVASVAVPEDDPRARDDQALLLDAADEALGDGRVPVEAVLDLERRDPDPADLQEVVGTAAVEEVPVPVAYEEVARADEIAVEGPLRPHVVAPVEDACALAAGPELPRLTVRDRLSVGVQQLRLVSRHEIADAPCAHTAGTVRDVDVVQLGRADAFEHLDAVGVEPAAVDVGGERLAGRETEAQ